MTLLHLALQSEWEHGQHDGRYTPARFAADGFVHCCDDLATAHAIARAHYAEAAEPVLLVRLNEAALDVEVTREARGGLRFPHVHGSIPLTAVISVQALDAGG